jgi:hypothetical protein
MIGASVARMMASIFQPWERDHDAFSPIEIGRRSIRRLLDRGDAVVGRILGNAPPHRHDGCRARRGLFLVPLHAPAIAASTALPSEQSTGSKAKP